MSGRRFIVWLTRATVTLVALSALFVGCSRQSEGERCDKKAAGDTDCNDGLFCIECQELARGSVDRCCPRDPAAHTDGNCDRADTPRTMGECSPATGGTGGMGGRGGAAGSGGSGAVSGSGGSGGSGATSGSGGSGATSGEGGAGDPAGAGGQ
jgi:hypothetical protein